MRRGETNQAHALFARDVFGQAVELCCPHQRGLGRLVGALPEEAVAFFLVSLRFGIGNQREHTLAEVASELGVSLERVRQIQVRAITKLRSPALRKAIDPYLNN